jgi:hypothetical protein
VCGHTKALTRPRRLSDYVSTFTSTSDLPSKLGELNNAQFSNS